MKNLTREERQRGRWLAFYSSRATGSKKLKLQIGGERVLHRLVGKFFIQFYQRLKLIASYFPQGNSVTKLKVWTWQSALRRKILFTAFPEI